MDRSREAVPIIDECVQRGAGQAVHPGMIQAVCYLRLRHFEKIGDAAGCRATAEMWENLKRPDSISLYTAACFRAVTAAVILSGDRSEAAAEQANAEADRAMAWLRQAVAAGYHDAEHMKKDVDLDALRSHDDFKMLLKELEARTKPK